MKKLAPSVEESKAKISYILSSSLLLLYFVWFSRIGCLCINSHMHVIMSFISRISKLHRAPAPALQYLKACNSSIVAP